MKFHIPVLTVVFNKIKRKRFTRTFLSIGRDSGFGPIGYGDTCEIWDKARISVGDHTWFGRNSVINVLNAYPCKDGKQQLSAHLEIGNNVQCTERCRITCAGHMVIEDDVLIAPEVFITDHNHGMIPNNSMGGGYVQQPLIIKDVYIRKGVWLGQRVCVLPGVTIGEYSIIGTNSTVTHSIPAYSMAVGSPARVVKQWDEKQKAWVRIE